MNNKALDISDETPRKRKQSRRKKAGSETLLTKAQSNMGKAFVTKLDKARRETVPHNLIDGESPEVLPKGGYRKKGGMDEDEKKAKLDALAELQAAAASLQAELGSELTTRGTKPQRRVKGSDRYKVLSGSVPEKLREDFVRTTQKKGVSLSIGMTQAIDVYLKYELGME